MMEDKREHITDGSPCWCGPKFSERFPNGGRVITHRTLPTCPECERSQRVLNAARAQVQVLFADPIPPNEVFEAVTNELTSAVNAHFKIGQN